MSYGLCSISKTTPSYAASPIACAFSGVAPENVTNAGLPDSSAAITPFSRAVSGIAQTSPSNIPWGHSASVHRTHADGA